MLYYYYLLPIDCQQGWYGRSPEFVLSADLQSIHDGPLIVGVTLIIDLISLRREVFLGEGGRKLSSPMVSIITATALAEMGVPPLSFSLCLAYPK